MYPVDVDPESGCRLPLPRREQLDDAGRRTYDRVADPDLLNFERRDIDATGFDHLLQPSAETDAAIRLDGSKIAGQKVPVAVERFGIELRRVEIAWRDATAYGELADLTGIQGLLRHEIQNSDPHTGKRQPLAVQSERQRVMRIRHRAVPIGLGRAIDIAKVFGTQRLDRHCDIFGRADGQSGPHGA